MSTQTPYMLTTEQTWLDWFDNIKSTALKHRIWDYMNPNADKPATLPSEPHEPEYSSYQEGATAYRQLNDEQRQLYDHDYQQWERRASRIESILDKYYSMDQHIRSTIAMQHQPLIRGKDSVYEKLKALSSRFATNPYYHIRHLFQRWQSLIKTPHLQNLQRWLADWESFLVEAQGTGHIGLDAKTTGWEPIFGFIDAIRPIEPTFAEQSERDLQKDGNMSIHQVIDEYRGHLQGSRGSSGQTTEVTYATLGSMRTASNQQSSNKQSKDSNNTQKGKDKRPCVCGYPHAYSQCYYIIESLRPANWSPKGHVEAAIAEKRKDPILLGKLNKARRTANLPEWPVSAPSQSANMVDHTTIQGVFSVSSSLPKQASPELRKSFILDSGATTHVCNDFTRFFDFRHDRQWLAHGDSGTWIEGYGKVMLQMKAPDGHNISKICLGDVAYCPGFHLNIVSFPRLFDRKLFWNTEREMLYLMGKDVARVEKHGNLFIIEQGKVSQSVNANIKQSSKPLISEAPAEIWHRRLGHIYHESMAKLPQMVDGIAITGSQANEASCLPCELAKAQSQISRRPAQRARRPGERVHLDLIDNMPAYNGNRYCCHFMDDATRLHVVYTLNNRHQAEVMNTIRAFVSLMKTQWGCKVAIFKLDGEKALGSTFYRFCKEEGIEWIESLPYTPEQNGPIERAGKTIIERSRSLMIDAQLPKSLWPEAYKATTYMVNRTPTRIPKQDKPGEYEWIIPIQRMHALTTGQDVRPNLANLRLYGCRAYIKRTERDLGSKRDKMEPRAIIGYLVGFIASNIWRIWLPEQKQVVSARDVKFDETKQYNPNDPFAAIKLQDDEPDMPGHVPPQVQLPQSAGTYSRSQQPAPAHRQSTLPQGVQQPANQNQQHHEDDIQMMDAPAISEDLNEIQEQPQLPLQTQPQVLPPPPRSNPEYEAMDVDENMADAPPLAEQNTQPNQQQVVDERVDERMDGVETSGLATPRLTASPNKQTNQTPNLYLTPHQPTHLQAATPASPTISRTIRTTQPAEPLLSNTPEPDPPQVDQPPHTPTTAPIEARQPDTPNPPRYAPNEPTPPPPPGETIHFTPSGPRNEIHGDPQDPRNITWGPRTRRPRQDPDYQTYAAIQPALPAQAEGVDEAANHEIMQAYALGLADAESSQEQQPTQRLHQSQLPPEPKDWQEMKRHCFREEFTKAAHTEQQGLANRGTYSISDTPNASWLTQHGKRIIPLKWVFTYKLDEDGYLIKFKARICARGDLQAVTSEETRAATLATRIFRTMMALVAAFDLETDQLDAVNAFLNSPLNEEEYVYMPPGMSTPGKVWRLYKALYGFRISPRLWQKEFSRSLTELGLKAVPDEPCLFLGPKQLMVFFYVDDIILIYPKHAREEATHLKQQLMQRYELRQMGAMAWFLGIRVIRDRPNRKLWLLQDSYISKIANRFHLTHELPESRLFTPIALDGIQPYQGQATHAKKYEYMQKVGSLLYATIVTRPDAAKAANKLAEFAVNPGPEHLKAVNRAITYLYHTQHYALEYSSPMENPEEVFICASDAAYGDLTGRKSSEGYLCKLFGAAIDWRASKQQTVTTSTTEAELLAISEAAKSILWWKRLFDTIDFNPEHELSIKCDNAQTINLLSKEDPQLRTKLRHVDIHHHWLRQEVQAQRIAVNWTATAKMPADGLTKILPTQRHAEFIRMLGLVDLGPTLASPLPK